jgi:hypothetical protein
MSNSKKLCVSDADKFCVLKHTTTGHRCEGKDCRAMVTHIHIPCDSNGNPKMGAKLLCWSCVKAYANSTHKMYCIYNPKNQTHEKKFEQIRMEHNLHGNKNVCVIKYEDKHSKGCCIHGCDYDGNWLHRFMCYVNLVPVGELYCWQHMTSIVNAKRIIIQNKNNFK